MADIIVFKPLKEVAATENVSTFVEQCRNNLKVFKKVHFEDDAWDISEEFHQGPSARKVTIYFSKWSARQLKGRIRKDRKEDLMDEPFRSFAKAYFAYQWAYRPMKVHDRRMNALCALEAALTENGGHACVTKVNGVILSRAADLLRNGLKSTAFSASKQLEHIAKFLRENHLTSSACVWVTPLPLPSRQLRKVGPEFDELRAKRLPSAEAIAALAEGFRQAKRPQDIVTYSLCALLCSAPDRINEVLRLHSLCEHHGPTYKGEAPFGLRWKGSKGADDFIKWIIPVMKDVVQEALTKIRKVTDEARAIARWYENNPNKMYLPPSHEHFRNKELLTPEEVTDILFEGSLASWGNRWLNIRGIKAAARQPRAPGTGTGGRIALYRFEEVEEAVLSLLPPGFPVLDHKSGLKYSEALFVMRIYELAEDKCTYRCSIEAINYDHIYRRLNRANDIPTLLDQLGLFEKDGSQIRVGSHQLRHYLSTLAEASGLSQLDIAMWAGRRNIKHNAAYDHESSRDMQARILDKLGGHFDNYGAVELNDEAIKEQKMVVLPRSEFMRLKMSHGGALHTTMYGYCLHNWIISPCEQHADCINCEEEVCVKGEKEKEVNIRALRTETAELLQSAETAVVKGKTGAGRWVEHQRLTLDRLNQLCAILDDPSIEEGALIKLNGIKSPSRILQAHVLRTNFDSLGIKGAAHTDSATDSEIQNANVCDIALDIFADSDGDDL